MEQPIRITKSDAPYLVNPIALKIALFLFIVFGVGMLAENPELRPSVVEALIGLGVGLLSGMFGGRAYAAFLNTIAVAGKERPSVKWTGPFYAVPEALPYSFAAVFIYLGGAIISELLLHVACWSLPPLGMPWERFSSMRGDAIYTASTPTQSVYLMTAIWMIAYKMLRWHQNLPDERQTETAQADDESTL